MKPHYFSQAAQDKDDIWLTLAKGQGYVPQTCLLGGNVVMGHVNNSKDPCHGCHGPRNKSVGR